MKVSYCLCCGWIFKNFEKNKTIKNAMNVNSCLCYGCMFKLKY